MVIGPVGCIVPGGCKEPFRFSPTFHRIDTNGVYCGTSDNPSPVYVNAEERFSITTKINTCGSLARGSVPTLRGQQAPMEGGGHVCPITATGWVSYVEYLGANTTISSGVQTPGQFVLTNGNTGAMSIIPDASASGHTFPHARRVATDSNGDNIAVLSWTMKVGSKEFRVAESWSQSDNILDLPDAFTVDVAYDITGLNRTDWTNTKLLATPNLATWRFCWTWLARTTRTPRSSPTSGMAMRSFESTTLATGLCSSRHATAQIPRYCTTLGAGQSRLSQPETQR